MKKRNKESNLNYLIFRQRYIYVIIFRCFEQEFTYRSIQNKQRILQKRAIIYVNKKEKIYSYEYMDLFKKYDKPELPGIEMFHDTLHGKECKTEEYKYAKKVYEKTKCKNLGDYTLKYMINDVLLLADVFETFRETCMRNYDLDSYWHYIILRKIFSN